MKKKLFLLIAALMAMGQNAFAYDFSAVAPSGQTLYYKIIDSFNHYVKVTYPNDAQIDACGLGIWDVSAEMLWGSNPKPMGSIVLPDTVSYNGITYTVKAIGCYTFSHCLITSIVMSNTIDSLCTGAFCFCSVLSNVTFSNSLRFIGRDAFRGCYLGDVVLPPSVRVLESGAMINANVTSITLNDSIETLGEGCLMGNPFTSLYIPASVKAIASGWGVIPCASVSTLTSIIVDPNNPYYDSRDNCNAIITSYGDLILGCRNTVVPDGVLRIIGWPLWDWDYTFDQLALPSSVLFVESYGTHIRKVVISSPIIGFRFDGLIFDTIQILTDTPPAYMVNCMDGVNYSTPIIVPCNSLSAYQASNFWSQFTNLHEIETPQISVNAEHGTATVMTYPSCGNDTATVSATTTEEHYHFVRWSDGSTQNPYSLVLNGNTTLTAIFAIDSVLVRATSANPTKGTVMGGGVVPLGGTTTLTAIPTDDNIFLCWSNGVRNNPYTLTVNSDTTLQAMFTLPDTLVVYDTVYVPVHDTTYVPVHDTTIEYINHYIHDTTFVNNYVHDTMIQYVSQYIHDTTYINNYVHDTMTQYVNQYVHDTTFINNYIHDTVRMTTQMFDTTIVNVFYFDTAIYNTYHFDTLIVNNHYYDTVYITTHHYDTIYITQEGIDGVDGINAKVYSSNGQVVVEGADGNMVTLYDVTGRILATKQDYGTPLRFDAPASGTYMIKIGNYQARKVVVIR